MSMGRSGLRESCASIRRPGRGAAMGSRTLAQALAAALALAGAAAAQGTIKYVSRSSSGERANGRLLHPSTSADGMRIAFTGYFDCTNLVPGDSNGGADVFVHDRGTGITQRVSVS